MEVYILDSLFRRIQVVDDFQSLIWTERFSAYGDFKLTVLSTLENRNRFVAGTRLAMSDSYRVMTVETFEDTTDDDGKPLINLSGRSIEAILDDRVARPVLSDTTTAPKWTLTGKPIDIANLVFHEICVEAILDPGDLIPNVIEGSIFPPDTIAPPADFITVDIDPASVYTVIQNLANLYDFGFRLIRTGDSPQLYFDIYTGNNLTSTQTIYPAVIFSPNLDNLQNTREVTTIASYKNVAYVISPVGHAVVYPIDVPSNISGLDRHVLLVNADDINDPDPAVAMAQMIQRGQEQLSQNRRLSGFDGEISQDSVYKYGRDYNLGDLIELQNVDGVINEMRVTEQIFTSDEQGESSYPTLTLSTFVTPGSWTAYQPTEQVWHDLDPDTTSVWANQE